MNSAQTVMNSVETVHCLLKAVARESRKKKEKKIKKKENANVKHSSKHESKHSLCCSNIGDHIFNLQTYPPSIKDF